MTTELKSDPRIKVLITLKEPIVYAGQYLEGQVNVQVQLDTQYKSIGLSLVGSEAISWTAELGKLMKSYENKRQTYRQELVLNRFSEMLKKGHYCFPFNILLPSSLPASMQLNSNNYITYQLKAFLPPYDQQNYTQTHELSLNIREPLRMVSSLSQFGTATSQCWKCLGSKQSGILHLQLQRNQINQGEPCKLKGFIDNTNGKFQIESFQVVLTRKITKASANGESQTITQDIATLIKPKKGVRTGAQKKFDAEIQIPEKITQYSAIGNIISRTFFVSLVIQPSCFYSSVRIQKHILVNNKIASNKVTNKLQVQNWNPLISPSVAFIALKTYIFNPSTLIKITNQKGSVVASSKLQTQQLSISNLIKISDV